MKKVRNEILDARLFFTKQTLFAFFTRHCVRGLNATFIQGKATFCAGLSDDLPPIENKRYRKNF